MEIFGTFGLDPYLTGAQIVNFLIVLYILKRFLYKPVFELLKKRELTIKEGLTKTEEARKALEAAQVEEKKILKKAQETAKIILQDARDQSEQLVKETEERAKKQADRMLEEAKMQIQRDIKEAEMRLRTNITELSVELLKKSLSDIFNNNEQEQIVDRAVKRLKKRPN